MLKNLLILGDSYSTFEGYIPEGYRFYYSMLGRPNMDVTRMTVDHTWWKRVIDQVGGNLVQNNKYERQNHCPAAHIVSGTLCRFTDSICVWRCRGLSCRTVPARFSFRQGAVSSIP